MASLMEIYFRIICAMVLITACGISFLSYIFLDSTKFPRRLHNSKLQKWSAGSKGQSDTEPYDVIVLAYMRSGSSHIGKLVGDRKDTFYWYEPLRKSNSWTYLADGQMVCAYNEEKCENISGISSVHDSLDFLLDIYRCKLRNHSERFARLMVHGQQSSGANAEFLGLTYTECKKCVKMVPIDCINGSHLISSCKCPDEALPGIFHEWIKRCNNTIHKATKVLRVDTSHAQYLLENHKRLKLIQVFRDPRAIINSRSLAKWYGYSPADVKILCKRMENDIANAERLKLIYPDRVKIIQYEDFYDPNRTAEVLYNFLNMKRTDYVNSNIRGLLKARNPEDPISFHPDSYRNKLNADTLSVINRYCERVIKHLGLRMFNSTSEMRNMNLGVILDKVKYRLN